MKSANKLEIEGESLTLAGWAAILDEPVNSLKNDTRGSNGIKPTVQTPGARQAKYSTSAGIFFKLRRNLHRAGFSKKDIDYCLKAMTKLDPWPEVKTLCEGYFILVSDAGTNVCVLHWFPPEQRKLAGLVFCELVDWSHHAFLFSLESIRLEIRARLNAWKNKTDYVHRSANEIVSDLSALERQEQSAPLTAALGRWKFEN